jgi:hypothetical protein
MRCLEIKSHYKVVVVYDLFIFSHSFECTHFFLISSSSKNMQYMPMWHALLSWFWVGQRSCSKKTTWLGCQFSHIRKLYERIKSTRRGPNLPKYNVIQRMALYTLTDSKMPSDYWMNHQHRCNISFENLYFTSSLRIIKYRSQQNSGSVWHGRQIAWPTK